ncbi:MAG: phosphopantothenoylcysteine decarboxylase [Planctomycetaceae bacterium]|nr:phosphopantothenoylcysteine decarboxylase [Planctomycetaceae bacterium]
MTKVLVTCGSTREYIDPVRFLSNGSSGKMGLAIVEGLLEYGFEPVIVSGPVSICYPAGVEVYFVESTLEMLSCCVSLFGSCKGIISAAAPCDFKPKQFSPQKITKPASGSGITIELEQTKDILAELGKIKKLNQWSVGFALETQNEKQNALAKLKQKNCDLIIINSPNAINNNHTKLKIYNTQKKLIKTLNGTKKIIGKKLVKIIIDNLK